MIRCEITSVKNLASTIKQVLLKPSNSFSHLPGQYLELHLPNGDHRPFSIANNESDLIELHIRYVSSDPFSNALHTHLETHHEISITGPVGDMTYPSQQQKPYLLIAQGTGFAPLKAIIEAAFNKRDHTSLHLFWSASNHEDLYFHESLVDWTKSHSSFHYTPVLSSDVLLLISTISDLNNHEVYVAGSYEFVKAAFSDLHQRGVPNHQFHSDMLKFSK